MHFPTYNLSNKVNLLFIQVITYLPFFHHYYTFFFFSKDTYFLPSCSGCTFMGLSAMYYKYMTRHKHIWKTQFTHP